MKLKLIMTKGLPASGKSTWAKLQVREQGFKRINKDDLRNMVDDGIWTKQNEKAIISIRNAIADDLLSKGHSVIIDDTNLVPKHEECLKEIAAKHNAQFEIKDFTDVPLEVCLERDKHRPNYVGEAVIKRMYSEHIKSPVQTFVRKRDEKLKDCIIVDLDGTIANNTGVRHWNNFNDVYLDDTNDHILTIINVLLNPHAFEIFFFSGREGTEKCLEETRRWIVDKVVERYYYIRSSIHQHGLNLVMRQAKDYRKDSIVKKEMFDAYIEGKYNVLAVFDDRNQVVDMWRELGLPTLQCNKGDF